MTERCAVCGRSEEGYGLLCFGIMDGRYYCLQGCLPEWRYVRYRIDDVCTYYRSFSDFLVENGGTVHDYVREFQPCTPLGPRWAVFSRKGEEWERDGNRYRNSHAAHHSLVVYGEDPPEEIKEMETVERNETTVTRIKEM